MMPKDDEKQPIVNVRNILPQITIKQGAPYENPKQQQLQQAEALIRGGKPQALVTNPRVPILSGNTQTIAPPKKKGFFARLLDRVRNFFISPTLPPPKQNASDNLVINSMASSDLDVSFPTTPVLNPHTSSLEMELDLYNDPRSPHYLGSLPLLPIPMPPKIVRFSDKVEIKLGTVYSELEQKRNLQFSDEQLQKVQINLENELKSLKYQVRDVMHNVRETEQGKNRLNADMLKVQQTSKAEERLFDRQLPSTEIKSGNKRDVSYNLNRNQIDQRYAQTALKSTQAQAQLFFAESDKQQLKEHLDDTNEKISAVKELRAAGKKLDKAEKELNRLQEKGADMRLLIPLAQSHVEKCTVEYESKLRDVKEKRCYSC